MKQIKHLTVVHKITEDMQHTLNEVPHRGGFFNWMFAFKGEIAEYSPDIDFEKYDVVQINMAPVDQIIVPEVRKAIGKNSSTKLVLNNDHVPEVWSQWLIHPWQYWQIQEQGDMVFATHEAQTAHMIDGCKTIPHPHDINTLKRIRPECTENNYGIIFHWWEGKTYQPAIFDYKLKKEFKSIQSKLYAYREDRDNAQRFAKTFFNTKVPSLNFPDYLDDLSSNNFVYEPTSCHTYGRNTVDMAALGVPMIGSNTVGAMKRCFPDVCNDPYRLDKTLTAARQLLTDDEFRLCVIDTAYEQCEYYNYENSKKRFLEALEECE